MSSALSSKPVTVEDRWAEGVQWDDYYDHKSYCGNCGSQQTTHILNGVYVANVTIICDNCGCRIKRLSEKPFTL